MRHVKDITPHPENTATPEPPKVDPITARLVNELFRELQAIFPAWRQAWPDDEALRRAKASWIKAFMGAGIKRLEQIRYGLQQCRLHGADFAPSVGRFLEWCDPTPESLGLPTEEQAYREACRLAHPCMAGKGKWTHDAVFHAACETGFINLNRLAADASRKLFARNYAITVRMVLAGEKLRSMPLALPAKPEARRTPEVGRAALAAMRETMRGGRGDA